MNLARRDSLAVAPDGIVINENTAEKYAAGTEAGDVLQPALAARYAAVAAPAGRRIYRRVR